MMSVLARILGFSGWDMGGMRPVNWDHVIVQKQETSLRRVLAFTRLTIDDVVNDPTAKARVRYYFRVEREVEREIKGARERREAEVARRVQDQS